VLYNVLLVNPSSLFFAYDKYFLFDSSFYVFAFPRVLMKKELGDILHSEIQNKYQASLGNYHTAQASNEQRFYILIHNCFRYR
jgi:hypothetical protein